MNHPHPPGVLLLIADDWSPICGSYGNGVIRTPHIDGLAGSATVFDHAYCTTPSCAASRASLLTGRHSHTHGQYGHCHSIHGFRTHESMRSLPAVLRDAGIASALVGKAHIAPPAVYPFDFTTHGSLGPPAAHASTGLPASLAAAADLFLQGVADRPFYLHIASGAPHRTGGTFNPQPHADAFAGIEVDYAPDEVIVPDWLPDLPAVRQDLADYYRFVTRFDTFVGAQLKMLEASGRAENTLVILMSDHGMPFPGAKGSCFDAGHHCPLILRAPGTSAGRCGAMVNWLDILPTVLDWLGVAPAHWPEDLPGRSLLPILHQPQPSGWEETAWSHNFHEVADAFPYRVLRGRRYKLVQTLNWGEPARMPLPMDLYDSPTWQAVLDTGLNELGQRPLERLLFHPPEALYDIEQDPLETRNLIDDPAFADIAGAMRERLMTLRERTADPWLEVDRQIGRRHRAAGTVGG